MSTLINFVELPLHYTDKYLHWSATRVQVERFRELHSFAVANKIADYELDELLTFVHQQATMIERDRKDGL